MTAPNPVSESPLVNHVFVDYENVHQIDLTVVGAKTVCFTLLVGAKQMKLEVDLVEKLMAHADTVRLVRLDSSAKNALDFAVAYYVGKAVAADPTGYFHIVSKDGGYDPLVEHLRKRNVRIRRHPDFTSLRFSAPEKVAAEPTKKSLMERALEELGKNVKNRPKKRKGLVNQLTTLCGKSATEDDALKLVEKLRKAGHITIDEKNVVGYVGLGR